MITSNEKFMFNQSFYKSFDKLCVYINDTTNKLQQIKPQDFTYGSCNTGYNLRFITPSNISTFIDNYINALKMKLIHETFSDANKFMVASIKKMLSENGCPVINNYTINTRPMYVDQQAQTPSDLISFIEGEIVKTSVYSSSQIRKRFELIQKDLKIINKHNFVIITKRIVDELPNIISRKGIFDNMNNNDILMGIIGQFILFGTTLNALTLKGMWLYAFPKNTLGISIPPSIDRQDEPFIESVTLKTDPMLISLTDGIRMNKTNMLVMKEQLPIDINIKNIVIQDQTKNFGEMTSAIKFVLTDGRSPITDLILKYYCVEGKRNLDDILANCDCKGDVYSITKMFIKYKNYRFEDKLFETENNWLDLIVSGNDFVDHNYRRDTMTNHVNTNPIINTLDMIYRVYGEDLTSNEELAINIIKVANIMVSIAEEYENRIMSNRPLVKDILIVFGEIITRNMLKLYWNNNVAIELSMNMDNTMSPGYIYKDMDIMESFISGTSLSSI